MNLVIALCIGWFFGAMFMWLYLLKSDLIRTTSEWEAGRKRMKEKPQ